LVLAHSVRHTGHSISGIVYPGGSNPQPGIELGTLFKILSSNNDSICRSKK
jgi:hypothetical protein